VVLVVATLVGLFFLVTMILAHRGRPVLLIVGLLIYLSLQEFLGLVLFNLELLNADSFAIFQSLKDIFILVSVVGLVLEKSALTRILLFLRSRLLLTILLGLYISLPMISLVLGQGDAALFAKIASIRQFLMPVGLVLLGFLLLTTVKDLQIFLRAVLLLNLFLVVVGLIEMTVVDRMIVYDIFNVFDYKELRMSEMLREEVSDHLEAKFSADDYVPMSRYVAGTYVPRFVSLYFEPLTAAYTLMIAAVISYSINNDGQARKRGSWRTKSNITRGLLFIALLFSLTRGAIAGFLIAVIVGRPSLISRSIAAPIAIGMLALLIAMVSIPEFIIDTLLAADTSSMGHIEATLNGLAGLAEKPFGWGLGVGSYVGRFYSQLDHSFGENLFLVYGTSLGVPYMMIAIAIMFSLMVFFHRLRFDLEKESEKVIANIMLGLTVAFFLVSLTTEVWLGLRNSFVYWSLVGYLIRCSSNIPKNSAISLAGVRIKPVRKSQSQS
jgi:hypothetical protein